MQIWEHDPRAALRFDASDVRATQLGTIVESGLLAQALWRRLPAGVARSGVQVQTIEYGESGVRLHLVDGDVLKARLAVIAEGRDSRLDRKSTRLNYSH